MFKKLEGAKRLLVEVELVPVQGNRLQPTGFPDLGAATYQLPDGTRMLLVESAQSMANRLENAILGPENEIIYDLTGLSYIRVHLTEGTETYTNSLVEAHRINSPYFISNETFKNVFIEESGYDLKKPLNWQKIARAIFKYDINSLLHGAFLANLGDGRIKMSRSLSAFIEATNAREAVSGGVKNNPIDPTGTLRAKTFDKDVYGNVPYQRVEYTADNIMAYFNLDLGMLESYNLGEDAFNLLVSLAIYKIWAFLAGGTRLRTACDLKIKEGLKVTEPKDFVIPEQDKILTNLKEKIKVCKDMFADPPVTELATETVIKKKESQDAEE